MTISDLETFLEEELERRIAELDTNPHPSLGELSEFRELARVARWLALNVESLNISLLSVERPVERTGILPDRIRLVLEVSA